MFRFHWNHYKALLQKYIDPLHRITKMRYGFPDAYIKLMYCKHKFYVSVWDPITHFSNSM